MELATREDREGIAWLRGPFGQYVKYLRDTHKLIVLATLGISRMERDAQLEESLVNYDLVVSGIKEPSEEQNLRIAEAKERAAFAKKEIKEGFPLLCAHSLVGLWGAFEAAVDDFLSIWLEAHPANLTEAGSIRLRVSASDLLVPIEQDRVRLVLAELARSLSVEARIGASRFEAILSRVGLSGEVPETVRHQILEMQQVRHIWAHRGGRPDGVFQSRCPWMEPDPNGRIKVDVERLNNYGAATVQYAIDVENRALRQHGFENRRGRLYRIPGGGN
jgi:hypothetical protein